MSDIAVVAVTRVAVALFIAANALALCPGATHPLGRLSILSGLVILLSPIPAAATHFARNFRLNESLIKGCKDASEVLAGPLLVLLALGVGALRLLSVQLPGFTQKYEVEWLVESAAAAADSGWCGALYCFVDVCAFTYIDTYSCAYDNVSALHQRGTFDFRCFPQQHRFDVFRADDAAVASRDIDVILWCSSSRSSRSRNMYEYIVI